MNDKFTETTLMTEFGLFNIRVYKEVSGKETVVLYTEKLDYSSPILTRIHSECLTGDIFSSLQCDCRDQLHKSLKLISDSKNGVLIYLRQEGRGIGLFKKIKSYQLQKKGHDTFEANLLLGHLPDERTYELAKTALDDLGIKQVKLLTNNPAKVSDLTKLGIDVIERIPITTTSNEFNRNYLGVKRDKFNHYLNLNN